MKYLIALLPLIILVSCSNGNYNVKDVNGVRVVSNKNIENSPNLNFRLTKLYEINTDNMRTNFSHYFNDVIKFDNEGNLFLLDYDDNKIHKYDKEGRFITSFCRKGEGPGEAESSSGFSIENDTIRIIDNGRNQYVKFDTEGNYLGSEEILTSSTILKEQKLGKGRVQSTLVWKRDGDKLKSTSSLQIRHDDKIDTLYSYSYYYKEAHAGSKSYMFFEVHNDKLFFFYPDLNRYRIIIYNEDGIKTGEINKSLKKIPYPEKEKKRFWKRGFKLTDKYILSVYGINFDKYGNLWAQRGKNTELNPELEDKLIYDIFNPEGVFLKKIVRDSNYPTPFAGDKYIEFDREKNSFIVYSYELRAKS